MVGENQTFPPFDVDKFRTKHPHHFPNLTDEQLEGFWEQTFLFHSPVFEPDGSLSWKEEQLLFLLVCHLATLAERGNTAGIGAVNSASEGGVSVSFSGAHSSGNGWWFEQTPCGAAYWQYIRRMSRGGIYFAYKPK